MKFLPQKQTLALIAKFRSDRDMYETSTRETSEKLIEEIRAGTYATEDKPELAIAGLNKQREREQVKQDAIKMVSSQ